MDTFLSEEKMTPKYRITRDTLNWVVEVFEGGQPVSRGRYVGRVAQEKWVPRSFHISLEGAALKLLDLATGNLVSQEQEILEAIKEAKAEVIHAVREVHRENP